MPRVRVGTLDLFYQDDDFADPWTEHDTVVLLHGFGRNGNFWRAWVPYLAHWFRVIRLDMRGCGRSGDPGHDYVFDVSDLSGDIVAVMDSLGLERVHLIGESGGGVVSAWTAGNRPERVSGLVLVSTPLRLIRHENPTRAGGYTSVRDGLVEGGLRAWWLRSRGMSHEDPVARAREEYLANEFARTPLHVALAMWDWIDGSGLDLTEALARIAAPTLLMTPGRSNDTSMAEQRQIAALIPRVTHRVYPDATHEMYYLRADELAPEAAAFLRSERAADRTDGGGPDGA